ncbi:Mg-chelatase subunit ChlD/ABC-type Fe3+ transport system substrate-binding protein [Agromyces cerinus]|uniref:VWA domain-containing protein n=1 Tax=Agromyces cerinus TaxID=33878 RepID=UPI00195BDB48|nr:VWA domain-containing protein [Agromyces cerinus]MBM7831345.1 Mg-chelatase subunit ChlD/ABC-type Fe3+ transport system substrate-binding protein [Agromyces cerinus]
MGRHSEAATAKKPGRKLILSIIGAVVVVGVVSSGVFVWVGGYLNPLFASADSGCAETERLAIVADTSIAPALADIAEKFDAKSDLCVSTEITAQDSADTAAVVASGGAEADAWIPEATVWVDRMNATATSLGQSAPEIDVRESVASSPVVFAGATTKATELAAEPVSWARVLGGTLPTILPDPEASAASLAGLLALRGHSSPDDPRQFAGAMIELSKTIPASTSAAFGSVTASHEPAVVVTSEAQVAAYNLDGPAEALVAAYPVDGTVSLDYPLVRLSAPDEPAEAEADGDTASEEKAGAATHDELLDAFETAVRKATKILAANGFRAPDGSGKLDVAGVGAEAPAATAALDGATQLEILRAWSVLTLRSRMLAVIDVSGSMEEPAENGLRRIDIFQQAAVGAMQKFSGEVELGVWVFSTARNGELDYEDLSPIAPLADVAHTQQIAGIIQSLPDRLGGATGLYDTTLAAVKRVRESYDPEKVNSVLLFTDGKNEDENGIDLDTLLAELAKIDDPSKPVPVIMIGFGPDTDLAAMQRIAQATKGAAYSASKPEDLGTVLVDALSQRSCRPNCG